MEQTLQPATRFLCILAMPRTGSSFLEIVLQNCDGFVSCGEPFNERPDEPLLPTLPSQIREHLGLEIANSAEWHGWKVANPAQTLEFEARITDARVIVFKLFPEHLGREVIVRDIFARTDMAYVILHRRPIESFISDQKAAQIMAWRDVDTTSLKPILNAAKFPSWARRHREWYDWALSCIRSAQAPFVELSYERHIHRPDGADPVPSILEALRPLGLGDIAYDPKFELIGLQDKEERYELRCANWEDFVREVASEPEGEALLNWARMSGPRSEPDVASPRLPEPPGIEAVAVIEPTVT